MGNRILLHKSNDRGVLGHNSRFCYRLGGLRGWTNAGAGAYLWIMLRFVMIALALLVLHAVPFGAAADTRMASGQSDIVTLQTLPETESEGQTPPAQQGAAQQSDCPSERGCAGAFAFLPGQDLTLPARAFRRLTLLPPDAAGKGLAPAQQMRPPRA